MNKKDTKRYLIMLIFFALVSALAFTEGIRRLTEQMPPDISASPLLIGVCTSIILSGPATMTLMLWDVFNFNYDAFPAMWAIRHVLMATLIFICTVINLEKDFTTALSINFILNAAVISGSDVYCHGLEKPVNLKT